MQPTTSSALTPLALKTAGAVLIISSLIDLVFMLVFPPEQLDLRMSSKWWLYATSQLVDRGLLPLVGIAFMVTGDWIKIVATEDGGNKGAISRIAIYVLASLLGLVFVLVIPFQLNATNDVKSEELKNIGNEVAQIEKGIKNNLNQINAQSKDKIKEQITAIEKELKSGQSLPDRRTNLQITKDKLELLLNNPEKFKAESEQNLQQLQKKRLEVEDQAGKRMLKTGVRTSLASVLLSIAYITIGWSGLRRVLR